MAERLQKILSQWGVASRRKAEALIVAGRVELNGCVALLGQQADPQVDAIAVDGVLLQPAKRPQRVYFLLNKPRGVVSTCSDPEGRPTVLNLLPDRLHQHQGIHPVGRLDTYSTGALLLTNDGQFTYQLTHPRHEIEKFYRVTVTGHPSAAVLAQWRRGIALDGQRTLPAGVELISEAADYTTLAITLREGRNRQVRRVAEALGHPVKELHRWAIGEVQLGDLAPGQCRPLTPSEHQRLTAIPQAQAKKGDPRVQ